MIPSKQHFCKILADIDAVRKRDSVFSEQLTEYFQHYTVACNNDEFIDSVIEFVEACFCCCGKVSWFVFDLDFGRAKPPEGKVYYPDAGVLYDYLVSELDSV